MRRLDEEGDKGLDDEVDEGELDEDLDEEKRRETAW